jgi:TonB family protein
MRTGRFILVVILGAVRVAAADGTSLQQIRALMNAGKQAEQKMDIVSCEEYYTQALRLARQLPAGHHAVLSEALKSLGEVHDYQKKHVAAEALLRERIAVLEQNQIPGEQGLSLALFDLVTHFGITAEPDKAEPAATRAVEFFDACIKRGLSDARTCDRRLADVQGMMGSILFNAGRYSDSQPWFKSVVERSDESVRPEIMRASLQAYAKLLLDGGQTEQARDVRQRTVQLKERNPVSWSSGVEIYKVGEGGVTSPRLIDKVEPAYTDGRAHNIRVKQGLGMGLDEQAIAAIEQWRFSPALKDGKPVAVSATIEVNFRRK